MIENEPSKEPHDSRAAKAARNMQRQHIRDRIDAVAARMVDAAERIVETLNAPPAKPPAPPLAVARRQLANMLRTAQFCDLKICQRARCCRGEPLHCLRIAVPLLPEDELTGLLRKGPARQARRGRRSVRVPASA